MKVKFTGWVSWASNPAPHHCTSVTVSACLFQGCLPPRRLPHFIWSHGLELRLVLTVPRSSDGFSTHRSKNTESTCDENSGYGRHQLLPSRCWTTACFLKYLKQDRFQYKRPNVTTYSRALMAAGTKLLLSRFVLLHRPKGRGCNSLAKGWESLFTITPAMCDGCLAYWDSREGCVSQNNRQFGFLEFLYCTLYEEPEWLFPKPQSFIWIVLFKMQNLPKHNFFSHWVIAEVSVSLVSATLLWMFYICISWCKWFAENCKWLLCSKTALWKINSNTSNVKNIYLPAFITASCSVKLEPVSLWQICKWWYD